MKPTLEGIREWRGTETRMKPTPEGIRVGNETKYKNEAEMNLRAGNEPKIVNVTKNGKNPRIVKRNPSRNKSRARNETKIEIGKETRWP